MKWNFLEIDSTNKQSSCVEEMPMLDFAEEITSLTVYIEPKLELSLNFFFVEFFFEFFSCFVFHNQTCPVKISSNCTILSANISSTWKFPAKIVQ